MREETIIYPPGLPFRAMWQRPQQLLKSLAKLGYKTVFCSNLQDMGGQKVYLTKDPFLWETEIENMYLCFNIERYRRTFPEEKLIFYASSGPNYVHKDTLDLPGTAGVHAFLYDELDDFPTYKITARRASSIADHIIYSSRVLGDIIESRRETLPEMGPATYVPNACDFTDWDLPMNPLRPPYIVMYIGAIAPWIDYNYILATVKGLPDIQFWFVGASFEGHPDTRDRFIELANQHNVRMFGHMDYRTELRQVAKQADMLWVPFDVSDTMITVDGYNVPKHAITNPVNPIKFWEYLATGRPILGTRLPELLRFERDHLADGLMLKVTNHSDEAIDFIRKMFSPESIIANRGLPPACGGIHKMLAMSHTWDQSAAIINEVIQGFDSRDLPSERAAKIEVIKQRQVAGDPEGEEFLVLEEEEKEELL